MNLINRIKEAAEILTGKASDKSIGDDFLANYIIKFTSKQEHINEILESKGSNYRIGNMEVGVGVPPQVTFIVEKK